MMIIMVWNWLEVVVCGWKLLRAVAGREEHEK
jgi:hypothetical protein